MLRMSEEMRVKLNAIHDLPITITSNDITNSPELGCILTKLSGTISSSGISKRKEDAIRSLMVDIEKSRRQYQENIIILTTVNNLCAPIATGDDGEVSAAIKKANQLIVVTDAKRLTAANNENIGNMLGMDNAWLSKEEPPLSAKESSELQSGVEKELLKKYGHLSTPVKIDSFFDSAFEASKNERKVSLLRDLNEEFNVCHRLQLLEGAMYRDLLMLRNMNVHYANEETVVVQNVFQLTELKAKIQDGNNAIRLFLKDKDTLKALVEIRCALRNEMTVCVDRLKELEDNKEAYKKLQKNEKYLQVLKRYRDILRQINNKKMALGQF